MIKAIFFDVDDTMYDHLIPFKRAIENVVAHLVDFPYDEAYHKMRYYSDKLSVEYGGADEMAKQGTDKKMQAERFQFTLADFDVAISFKQAEAIQQHYLDTQFNISMFSGMESLLQSLKQKGYLVGVLTNGAAQHQRKKIEALKLPSLIDEQHIFVSGAVGIDKPDRAIFDYIADRLSLLNEQCLYIGDSWRNDVIGATNAGWHVIWFNHRKVTKEDKNIAITEVQSIEELIAYLNRF